MLNDEEIFQKLISKASKAAHEAEVPIAAAIVKDGEIISLKSNETEKRLNFISHAELLCIEEASRKLSSKYLNECRLYVTVEPCQMCFYAARLCRLPKILYLLRSENFGREGPAYSAIDCHAADIPSLNAASLQLMQSFFAKKR